MLSLNSLLIVSLLLVSHQSMAQQPTSPSKATTIDREKFLINLRQCLGLKGRTWNSHSWEFNYEWDGCVIRLLQDHKNRISAEQEHRIRLYISSLGYYKWTTKTGFSSGKGRIKDKDIDKIIVFVDQEMKEK